MIKTKNRTKAEQDKLKNSSKPNKKGQAVDIDTNKKKVDKKKFVLSVKSEVMVIDDEPIPTLIELGKLIRKRRREKEISQGEVALKIGCSRYSIVKLENGDLHNIKWIIEACRELDIRNIKIID